MNTKRLLHFTLIVLLTIFFNACDSSSKVGDKSELTLRNLRSISFVPTNAHLYLEFSKEIDTQTVNSDTFYLLDNDIKVDGALDVESNRVTFLPKYYLDPLHSYTLVVTRDLLSEEGFGLLKEYHWDFDSLEHADNKAPKLIGILPHNNASIHTEIALQFNEQIVIEDSDSAIVELKDPSGSLVIGTSVLEFDRVRFTPASALSLNTQYHLSLKQEISDLSGNSYDKENKWDFNTSNDNNAEMLSSRQITSFETQTSMLSMTLADDILIIGTQNSINTYHVDSLTCKLSLLSSFSTPTPIYNAVINKNTIYAGTSDGIFILSINDSGVLGETLNTIYKTTSPVFDLAIKDDTLFVAQTFSGAQAFDISEASTPIKLFDFSQVKTAKELVLSDNRIYISDNGIFVFTLEGNLIEKLSSSSNIYDLEYDTNEKKLYIANGIRGFSSEVKSDLLSPRSFINNILAIKYQKNYKLLSDYNRGVILYDNSGFTQSFLSYKKELFGLAHKESCTLLGYEDGSIEAVDIFAPYVLQSSTENRDIVLIFNEKISDKTITQEHFIFTDEDSNPIAYKLSFDTNKTVTITAQEALHVKHHYSLHVKDIDDIYTNTMLEPFILNFDVNYTQNIAPEANSDTHIMQEDTVAQIDILDNDIDVNGDETIDKSSIVIVKSPLHGVVTFNDLGIASYQPYTDYFGLDTFEYQVSDDKGATSNTAIVSITINDVYDAPPNQAPIAVGELVTYYFTSLDIDVLANDSDVDNNLDPTTVVVTEVSPSALVTVNPVTGVVNYTDTYSMTYFEDSFKYTVKDTNGLISNEVTVTIYSDGYP